MKNINPKRGHFLISEPSMQDLNFQRTVLLLAEHNALESIGFILNQPTKLSVHDLVEDFPNFKSKIYIGGPVEKNTLHFLHSHGEKIENSTPISNNVYWNGNFETVKELISKGQIKESEIRFFLGYSGWSAGQLEYELQEKTWIVFKNDPSMALINNKKTLWRNIIKTMDKEYAIWSNMPEDPELN